jgi:acyl dehydratase
MNLQNVIERRFESVVQHYDWRDCALYALGLGFGSDPLDEDELPYVFEGRAQTPVPSQCVTLGWPEFWQAEPAAEIDWVSALHGEEWFELKRPLALNASIRSTHRISAVVDKGHGRGALIYFDTDVADAETGESFASIRATQFMRGDGGCGSHGVSPLATPALPAGATPTCVVEYRTAPQSALLYRLVSRDYIPIHADPVLARRGGFERPVSHGLNTMGIACRAVLKRFLPGRPDRLRSMFVRFVQPAYPGDTVRVELFEQGEIVRFRAFALERKVLLLDRGECTLASGLP